MGGRTKISEKKGSLDGKRVEKLNQLNFIWDAIEDEWETRFIALKQYKKKHGNCNVPRSYAIDFKLSRWVLTQRQFKKKNLLRNDKILRLERLGFSWNPDDDLWNQMFQSLKITRINVVIATCHNVTT
jgi:hypothetical protein